MSKLSFFIAISHILIAHLFEVRKFPLKFTMRLAICSLCRTVAGLRRKKYDTISTKSNYEIVIVRCSENHRFHPKLFHAEFLEPENNDHKNSNLVFGVLTLSSFSLG